MEKHEERLVTLEEFAKQATPEQVKVVEEVAASVAPVVDRAREMQVRTREEAEVAVAFLGDMKRELKKADEARRFVVDPLKAHVKRIDARFKLEREPLDEADQILRGKVVEFNDAEEKRRAEERARLAAEEDRRRQEAEDERRRLEDEARAEREAAARAAHAAQVAAERAERERREEMSRAEAALADTMRSHDDEALQTIVAGSDLEAAVAAGVELAARERARSAQEAAAAAAEAERVAREAEEARRAAPLPDVVRAEVIEPGAVRGGGSVGVSRKRWTATIEDEVLVPRKYLKVDQVAINRAVKDGERKIAGVRIEQVSELQVRS